MKRWLVVAALVWTAGASAQSRADEYGYPFTHDDNDYAPVVTSDTTLFYRPIRQADDLYARMAGHRLAFVQYRRRNRAYYDGAAIYEGLKLPVRYARQLRMLGGERMLIAPNDTQAAALAATDGGERFSFVHNEGPPVSTAGVTFTDRGYSAGVKASVAAGLGRGWSLDGAVEGRTGRDLHVDGVFTNAVGVSLRVAKRFADGSELSLLATARPEMRGLRSASTAEAFGLTGDCLYNPSWGWQNGRRRNARVRRDMVPLAAVSYTGGITRSTTLTASAAVQFGTQRQSMLGWYDAGTPMPDNYRFLPGYFTDAESAAAVEEVWRARDARYTQINWDEMYDVNRMSDRGAVYALEDRVRRITDLRIAVAARTDTGDGVTVGYGVEAGYGSQRQYRQMRDLLGAEYLTDIDFYLVDDDTFSNSLQNNLRSPDRRVEQGDRFGYDYAMIRRTAALFATVEYISGGFDLQFAGRAGGEILNRRGYFEKELFAGRASYGSSEKMRFTTYNALLAAGYTFTPQYRLCASFTAGAEAPDAEDLFLNPQYNNRTTDPKPLKKHYAAEVTGRISSAAVRAQLSLFARAERGGINTARYYDDLAEAFCDVVVSGIDILTYGAEAAASVRLARRWRADLTVAAMECRYASDPTVEVLTDAENRVVDAGSKSHMGGCTPDGVPGLTASAAVIYRSQRGWGVDVAAAWVGARKVAPSFVRRTERVAYQGASSPESFDRIVRQETLGDAFDTSVTISKRWYMRGTARLTAMVSVNNLLGTRDNVYSGYESNRVRRIAQGIQSDYVPLPTRYLYAYPRTILLSVSYSF